MTGSELAQIYEFSCGAIQRYGGWREKKPRLSSPEPRKWVPHPDRLPLAIGWDPFSSVRLQHLFGVRQRSVGQLRPADHPRQFPGASFCVE
jgi:hypothetical protein